ncbi:MAG: hypothetical protein RJA07_2156 [Bacteroidota bacterium]
MNKKKLLLTKLFILACLLLLGYNKSIASAVSNPFVTTWNTNNAGTSNSTSITIPTTGTGYSYDIDWNNDGTYDQFGATGSVTHDFLVVGTYTIAIRGSFPRIYFNNGGDKLKLLSITAWGNIAWTSMNSAFCGCSNLTIPATDAPNFTAVTDMSSMFKGCTSFNQPLSSSFNTSAVTNMFLMFSGCTAYNQALPSSFNTSAVTNMNAMFYGCTAFNQALPSSFNTSAVTNMNGMFSGCTAFNQALPSSFNTSAVTNMGTMFYGCTAYNQALPSSFNTSAVTDMSFMFGNCRSFNQALPSSFNTSAVTNMSGMFNYCTAFNQALPSSFNTSAVTNMSGMFTSCAAYNQALPISFNTSAVTNMGQMFYGCTTYNQALPISFSTSAVTNMSAMFYNCTAYNQALPSSFNTSSVTNMSYMFRGCTAYNQALPSSFNTSSVTDMGSMFQSCTGYNQALPSSFNTSAVTNMNNMFTACSSFNQALPSSFNTSAVTSMSSMFYGCSAYNQALPSSFNTSAVTNMSSMFRNCTSYNQALPSSFNTSAVTNMSQMFLACTAYNQALPSSFNTSAVTNMNNMFSGCTAYNQALPSNFNTSAVTNMSYMFFGCAAFNQALPSNFNTSAVTNMSYMFYNCAAFNQALPSSFNTSAVNTMNNMFTACSSFNQALPSSFNTNAVTNMSQMFSYCAAFNQVLPSSFNTTAVTDMSNMFLSCTAFNQNIGSWNIGAATTLSNIFNLSGISQATYDSILIRWNNAGYTNKNLGDASPLKYCAGATARASLIAKSWTIISDTLLCPCTVNSSTQSTTICSTQLPYIYFGKIFNAAGNDTLKRTNYKGCDSIVNLNVQVNLPSSSSQSTTICSTQLPFVYFGKTFNAAGNDTLKRTNYKGCDSIVNLNVVVTPATTWYLDADGDGYHSSVTNACTNPGANYSQSTLGLDCNDANAAINPGATELNDGIDNNCNGTIDEGYCNAPVVSSITFNGAIATFHISSPLSTLDSLFVTKIGYGTLYKIKVTGTGANKIAVITLSAGTAYSYYAKGKCSGSFLTGATTIYNMPTNLCNSVVTGLALTNSCGSKIIVNWSGSEPSYQVAYRMISPTVSAITYVNINGTNTTITAATSGTYEVSVRAICSSNAKNGYFCGAQTITVSPIVCNRITTLVATTLGCKTINIGWTSPACGVTQYKLYYYLVGSSTVFGYIPNVTSTSINFVGSTFGTRTYKFFVRPQYCNGVWGLPSDTSIVTYTATVGCTAPLRMGNIATVTEGDASTEVDASAASAGSASGLAIDAITVYPNPNNGAFTIDINNSEININKIMLINVLGETVYNQPVNDNNHKHQIDISPAKNGVYLLLIIDADGKRMTKQVIVAN